jgi:hypothetical protein
MLSLSKYEAGTVSSFDKLSMRVGVCANGSVKTVVNI